MFAKVINQQATKVATSKEKVKLNKLKLSQIILKDKKVVDTFPMI